MHRSAIEPLTGHLTKPKARRANKNAASKMSKRKPNMVCQPDSFIDRRIKIFKLKKKKPELDIKRFAAELKAKSQCKQDKETAKRSNCDIINIMKVKSCAVVPPNPQRKIAAPKKPDPSEIMVLSDSSDEVNLQSHYYIETFHLPYPFPSFQDNDDLLIPCNIRIDALLPHNASYTCYLPVDLPYREAKKQGKTPSPEKHPPNKSPSPEKDSLKEIPENISLEEIPERFKCFVKMERLTRDFSMATSQVDEEEQDVNPQHDHPMVMIPSKDTPEIYPDINPVKEDKSPKEAKICNKSPPKDKQTMPMKEGKPRELSTATEGKISPDVSKNTDARQRCLSTESSFDIKVEQTRTDLRPSGESTPPSRSDPKQEPAMNPRSSPPPLIPIMKSVSSSSQAVLPVPSPPTINEPPPTRPIIKLRNINDLLKSPPRPTIVVANPFEDTQASNVAVAANIRKNLNYIQNTNLPMPAGYVNVQTQQYYSAPQHYTHRPAVSSSANQSHLVPQQPNLFYLQQMNNQIQPTQNQMHQSQYLAQPMSNYNMYIPNQMFPIQMQPYSLSRQ